VVVFSSKMKRLLVSIVCLLLHPLAGYGCTLSVELPFYFLGSVVTTDGNKNQALLQYSEQSARWYKIGETLPQGYSILEIDKNQITIAGSSQSRKLYIGGCKGQITYNNLPPTHGIQSLTQTIASESIDNDNGSLPHIPETGQSRSFSSLPSATMPVIANKEDISSGVDPYTLEFGQSRASSSVPQTTILEVTNEEAISSDVDSYALEVGQSRTFSTIPVAHE